MTPNQTGLLSLNIQEYENIQDNENQMSSVLTINSESSQNNASLKELLALIRIQYLQTLNQKSVSQVAELNKRSDQINFLRDLLQIINMESSSSGTLDATKADLATFLQKAQELGVKVDPTKTSYTKDEIDGLKSNIRMTMESIITKNDILMQTIQQLIQEGHLAHQFVKDNAKTIHDMMLSLARQIKL